MKLPLQKLNGQVQVQLALPNLTQIKDEEIWNGYRLLMKKYHYQKSEKKAKNICWPKHEGDINECCTEFTKLSRKRVTGHWTLVSWTTYFLENENRHFQCAWCMLSCLHNYSMHVIDPSYKFNPILLACWC